MNFPAFWTRISSKINPVYFFVIATLLIQTVLYFLRPPFQSPDEFFHFCRAYQVSEGQFLPVAQDQRVGGELPVCLNEFLSYYKSLSYTQPYRMNSIDHAGAWQIHCTDTSRVFMDFPNTSTYSPVAYLPHSFALFVLRLFGCSIALQYFGARLFALLLYLVCMAFVIRSIPIYKWLIVVLLLLPMNLYMLNSFTGDTVTNMLTFMLIALVLKHKFISAQVRRKDLLLILLLGMLLAFSKVIYASLLFLLLIIPAAKFPSKLYKYASIAVIISISFFLANLWSGTAMKFYPTYEGYNPNYRMHVTVHPTANPTKQMEHLKENKTHLFKVIYSSLSGEPNFYLRSYVAHFGTYMDVGTPDWFYKLAFVFIILLALFEKNAFCLSFWDRLIFLVTAAGAYSLIVLSQHLVWNDVGSEKFAPLQGRYFVPLFPLLFMQLNHKWKMIQFNPAWFVVLFSLYLNSYCFKLLYKRYHKDPEGTQIVEFSCDMEAMDAQKRLLTSDPSIKLRGNNLLTEREHRSGKHALVLPPDSGGAICPFSRIRMQDLVEIYAWQKGTGGDAVAEGQGPHCEPYRFVNHDILVTDKAGWRKINLVYPMFLPCDSTDGSFYLFNSTKDTLYFDDLLIRVKRYR